MLDLNVKACIPLRVSYKPCSTLPSSPASPTSFLTDLPSGFPTHSCPAQMAYFTRFPIFILVLAILSDLTSISLEISLVQSLTTSSHCSNTTFQRACPQFPNAKFICPHPVPTPVLSPNPLYLALSFLLP